jgi:sugar phosphate isomerase/epimerase
MKFAICNEMFEKRPVEEVFRVASEIGYDGVEIAPFTLAESVTDIDAARRKAIRRSAEAIGVDITGLHWLFISPGGLYLNHPDDALRLKTRDYLIELIRFCGDLGGRVMVVGSPRQRNTLPEETFESTWKRTVQVFESCLPEAEARGVTVCIEPLDRQQTNFINTPLEAARMVREIDHPNFRMIVDVRSTLCQGEDLIEAIHAVKNEMAYFHLNDASGNGPGFGDVDFVPILQALEDTGYRGYGSVEVFDFAPGAETIARKSFDTLIQAAGKVVKKS